MTTKKQKIFLILFGLITSFLLLEMGLRFGGWIYRSYRIKDRVVRSNNENTVKILCLGDSFTFGEGAPKGYSYPEQLEKLLNEDGSQRKFIVYNGAVPGSNSSMLYKNLKKNVEIYKPDVIVIMTGCNNNSNFQDSNYFLFMNSSFRTYLYRLDAFLTRMRSYKIFKRCFVNLTNRINFRRRPDKGLLGDAIAERENLARQSYPAEVVDEKMSIDMERHLALAENYEKESQFALAIQELDKAIEINPHDDRSWTLLGFIYLHRRKDDELAIQACKKTLELNPSNMGARDSLWQAYYRAGNHKLALEQLNIINPKDETVSRILKFGLPDNSKLEIFEKMLRYDLCNIAAFIKSKRITLILQSYSANWADEIIREFANGNGISFVDNAVVFKRLKSSNGYKREDYLAEDGHCNANGYQLIAENVYTMLRSELKGLQ